MELELFTTEAATFAISATATASTGAALQGNGNSVRLVNEGPNACFIAISTDSGVVATLPVASASAGSAVNTANPVLAGEDVVFRVQYNQTLYISAICRSGQTAVLDVTRSYGA